MKYFNYTIHKIFFFIPRYLRESILFEFNSWMGRLITRRLNLDPAKKNYINLGSGDVRYKGLINVDFFFTKGIDYGADLRFLLKINSNSVDGIVTEHTMEHLTYASNDQLLAESFRILKPGGVIRIIVPDVSLFVKKFAAGDNIWFKRWEKIMLTDSLDPHRAARIMPTNIHALSFVTQEYGHVACWDFESMAYYLKKNNFVNIKQTTYREGKDSVLFVDLEDISRTNVSLYVEAEKPLS